MLLVLRYNLSKIFGFVFIKPVHWNAFASVCFVVSFLDVCLNLVFGVNRSYVNILSKFISEIPYSVSFPVGYYITGRKGVVDLSIN